jgi:hypothetical protein
MGEGLLFAMKLAEEFSIQTQYGHPSPSAPALLHWCVEVWCLEGKVGLLVLLEVFSSSGIEVIKYKK